MPLPPWGEVDGTRLPIGGEKHPVAVVPGPQGERPVLCPDGSGLDRTGRFTILEPRGVRGMTTADRIHGSAPRKTGLDRVPGAAHMQRTAGRHIRGIDKDDPTRPARIPPPILQHPARE